MEAMIISRPSAKRQAARRQQKAQNKSLRRAVQGPRTQGQPPTQMVVSRKARRRRINRDGFAAPSRTVGMSFPSGFAGRNRRSTVITEDEYIVDVSGSTGFATTSFPLNPGQAATFPWLAGEAKLFEKYRFLACEFYYRPQVSAYGLNGQAGKVMISCDYDASDAPPANKQQVEDTHPHADCMPYEEVHLSLETAEMFNTSDAKYVRPGGLPGAADIKTYDAGTISVSTVGNQNTTNIGELRVRYTVELSVPVLESATTAPVNNSVTWYQSTSPEALTTATPTTLALASKYANGLGAVNTSGSFVLPAGNYLVDIYGCLRTRQPRRSRLCLTSIIMESTSATVTTS